MALYQVQDRGIYHGLPVFPPDLKNLTAIVTGANGISGHYMVRVLAENPERWSKIYCLSRRPPAIPGGLPKNAEHIPLDFLQEPEDIADVLKKHGVTADYVFFFSYIQVAPKEGEGLWSNAKEMVRVNTQLLTNFLEALPKASIKPKRIMLQTGAKEYGVHLGPTTIPQEESDPRVLIDPNFYYSQEDFLYAYCKEHGIGWNVARPSFILGAVPDAAMNLCFPLAVYAAICKYLGHKLAYPGDLRAWESVQVQSSSMMNGYLEEWSVLTDGAANQSFNAFDDSAFTWGKFWPKLAELYDLEYTKPDLNGEYKEIRQAHDPPPRGFGPPGVAHYSFSLVDWAKRPEIVKAWRELAEKHNLIDKEFRDVDRVFSFTQSALSWAQSVYFSADKARALGWHGHVSSTESIFQVFRDFEKINMIPPVPASK